MTALPERPRLAEHAWPRWHAVDGAEIVVVHDARTGDLVRMPARAWQLIAAADGTRDLAGICLAASQAGALLTREEVANVLTDLHRFGLLTDGVDPFAMEAPHISENEGDRALDVLPGFTLTCDGRGACCSVYGSIRFTHDEAERARVIVPGAADRRRFLPFAGSGAQRHVTAPQVDGRCAYLAESGRCEVHHRAGAQAKPLGCRAYPATWIDDGEAVRVSVGIECACVVASIDRPGGEPLVPRGATRRRDLPTDLPVLALPDLVPIAPGKTAPRSAIAPWAAAALARVATTSDPIAAAWSMAAELERDGLDPRAASGPDAAPPLEEIFPWIQGVSERVARRAEAAATWRSSNDRVRIESERLRAWASRIAWDPASPAWRAGPVDARHLAVERFVLAAQIFGRTLFTERGASDALRSRAARFAFVRALWACEGAAPHARDPGEILAIVDALTRGGLTTVPAP